MRVLVTGGTGAFGRAVARRLTRLGADPVALARHEPVSLPPGVGFIAGDVADAASVASALLGCDAVVHLAWMMSAAGETADTRDINVGGSANVLAAMESTGCRRLVFASSVTVYGSARHHPAPFREDDQPRPDPAFEYAHHKMEVEDLIAAADVDAVVARVAATLGRGIDNAVTQQFAGPVFPAVRGDTNRWQLVHQEDVGRFLAEAAISPRTGTVNLAADDVLSPEELGELVERPTPRLPECVATGMVGVMAALGVTEMDPAAYDGLRYMPVVDTTRLREEWGFRCAWTSAETARDAARSLTRSTYVGRYRVPRRRRLPWVEPPPGNWPRLDGGDLLPAAPEGVAGEFDDAVHPDFDVFTATNLSEAFPGPLTPMSVTVSISALRAGQTYLVDFLGMSGEVRHEATVRMVSVFGHHIYLNVSLARETTEGLPGITPEDMDSQYLGIPVPEDFERPAMTPREVLTALRIVGRTAPPVIGLRGEGRRLAGRVDTLVVGTDVLEELSDAGLEARVGVLRDELAQCWAAVIIANPVAGAAVSAVERLRGPEAVGALHVGDDGLASANAIAGVEVLADHLRAAPALKGWLDDTPPEERVKRLDDRDPGFAREFAELRRQVGHRGPGELELANDVFDDTPDRLLDVIVKTADTPSSGTLSLGRRGAVERLATSLLSMREDIRDTTVRLTHELRKALREQGRRLAAGGTLPEPDDIWYLAVDEAFTPPSDAADRVVRRRAERERLRDYSMPSMFTRSWSEAALGGSATPEPDESTECGEVRGIAAAPGRAQGPARIVDSGDQLEPGDVLVTHVTDTGWTPFFAMASAVVTDVGGLMSHPAIVAREYGIPCVVGAADATRRLTDGQIVEVDGDAGIVRVVDDGQSPPG